MRSVGGFHSVADGFCFPSPPLHEPKRNQQPPTNQPSPFCIESGTEAANHSSQPCQPSPPRQPGPPKTRKKTSNPKKPTKTPKKTKNPKSPKSPKSPKNPKNPKNPKKPKFPPTLSEEGIIFRPVPPPGHRFCTKNIVSQSKESILRVTSVSRNYKTSSGWEMRFRPMQNEFSA